VRLAYLFSRYPIVSQTFCDTEILALERMGVELELYSIYAPPTSFRHGHAARIKAPIHYAPPQPILKLGEQQARAAGRWPEAFIADHERRYGKDYKAALRARNALYFADLFKARGITHFHVHFANRAAQTALFIKHLSGIPFSISTHGQDFMIDLGSDDLLREICREAEFVANETEFSRGLIAKLCPDSTDKLVKVFNGMDLANFPAPVSGTANAVPRIVSTGRLIEFKGFHYLIPACAELKRRKLPFDCEIIGEGPLRPQLQAAIDAAGLAGEVRLAGSLPQEEVFARLRGCDIFTLPCIVDRHKTSDVFPTVILEAMASAKPVVSTTVAGVPEQIVDGKTGLLAKPEDAQSLADALARLLVSPDLRREYGRAARERLESDFAIETTVQPLKALYEKLIKPRVAPASPAGGFACLVHEWPAAERTEAELRQLGAANPSLRIYAAHASNIAPPEPFAETLAQLRFLPDGMVLEGEWQQEREIARRIEVWRQDLGQKISSEDFLQQARYALFLRRWIERDGVRHLHAMTSRELLCGWLLHKLCGVTLSASIEEKNAFLPGSLIVQLAADCAGLRVGGRDLHEKLEPEFKAPDRFLIRHKHGRAIEPEFISRLAAWAIRTAHSSTVGDRP
jgi:glycosyltransferase involved in cell wall biosynthesis